jgi:hypothetical protein
LIDKVWLQKKWLNFIRPKEEENLVSPDHTIYVSDSTWWLDTQGGVFLPKRKWMCLCKINTRNSLKLFNNMLLEKNYN